jgi:PAT family beta-lactamase induction signal transducer AmpG
MARSRTFDRRLLIMAAFGFLAGLPWSLSGFTFRLWLSEGGVPLGLIGLTANIGLAYTLKFLWAPVLDRAPGPFARLGRRRGWLVPIQTLLAASCAALALSDPPAAPIAAICVSGLIATLSATQDIAIDAWRIETFEPRLQGAALAAYVWGYRAALAVSGAGAIRASVSVGWSAALLGVAALAALGPLVTLLAPEPELGGRTAPPGLRGAVVAPLLDLLRRPGAALILSFVALFKLGEAMAYVMTAPFYRSLGFDRTVIALSAFPYSLIATFAGTAVGGLLVLRLGVSRALLLTGCVQTLAMGMYLVLAASAGQAHVLYATTMTEAFAEGMADAAFLTFLSGLCSPAFTATQYALLSALAALALRTVGGLSGFLAADLGWTRFYTVATLAALPAMAVMIVMLRRYPPDARRAPEVSAAPA